RKEIQFDALKTEDNLWKLQSKEDNQNRNLLDSLYDEMGVEIFQTTAQAEITWRVIHHSTDCHWIKKWVMIYLHAIEQKRVEQGFFNQTLLRFYDNETGYCTKSDQLRSKYAVQEMISRYPNLVQPIAERLTH
ncbi:MAG: hypothetical protein AAFR14_06880, partial [Bacteroidota bacterium]